MSIQGSGVLTEGGSVTDTLQSSSVNPVSQVHMELAHFPTIIEQN